MAAKLKMPKPPGILLIEAADGSVRMSVATACVLKRGRLLVAPLNATPYQLGDSYTRAEWNQASYVRDKGTGVWKKVRR